MAILLPNTSEADIEYQTNGSHTAYSLPMSQEALDAMPFPFSIYTRDGLYVGANALVEQLFRVPSSAIIGRLNILTDPNTQDADGQALFRAAAAGRHVQSPPTYYDFSYPGTNSPERQGCWIAVSYLPFRDTTGQVTHVGTIIQDVTDRVEADEKMALLSMVIDNANDGIGITDMTGRITLANPAYRSLTGYGAELVGKTIADTHPVQPGALAAAITQIVTQGSWSGQVSSQRADGSTFPAEVSAFLIRDAQGQPSGMGAIIRDLSERQAQEQELRLTKFALDRSPDNIHWIDPSGTVVYVNDGACAMLGYTQEEFMGLKVADIDPMFPLHDWDAVWGQIKEQGVLSFESLHRRKDGSTFPVDVMANFLEFEGQEYACIVARDIGEKWEREEELRTFKAMVENTPDAIGVADADGTFLYANPAYRKMVQAEGDLVGSSGFDFIMAEDHALVGAALENLAEQHVSYVQARYQRKDGTIFPAAATIFLQEAPNGAQIIGFVRDISEQKRAEEEREAFQQQIIAAQQDALRELSTPLIPIADGVVVMPLIGSIDSNRAQLVIETLLSGVAAARAHTAIIDITGVPVVDTQVANALLRAAQAIKLLGAQVILTGIRPEVAQTLVGLGVDLRGIITRGTLQSGIAEALGRTANPAGR